MDGVLELGLEEVELILVSKSGRSVGFFAIEGLRREGQIRLLFGKVESVDVQKFEELRVVYIFF